MKNSCQPEINTKVTYDPRFKQLDSFSISEWDMMNESGALELLNESRASQIHDEKELAVLD